MDGFSWDPFLTHFWYRNWFVEGFPQRQIARWTQPTVPLAGWWPFFINGSGKSRKSTSQIPWKQLILPIWSMGDLQDPKMELLYMTIPYKAIFWWYIPLLECPVIGNFPAIFLQVRAIYSREPRASWEWSRDEVTINLDEFDHDLTHLSNGRG